MKKFTKHNGTNDITDGYADTGTASDGDVVDYQIVSTLPSITSASTYLTCYTFADTLSKGITYNKHDVVLEFFTDAACTDPVARWAETDGKFTVTYSTTDTGESGMTIEMTADGLKEMNTAVYSDASMVNSGYSDCTLRITYAATVNSSADVVYGDNGNPNEVVLTWKRTSQNSYDTLKDDAKVFAYGLELTKLFSDGKGDFSKVQFIMQNKTDGYYVKANDPTNYVDVFLRKVQPEQLSVDYYPLMEGNLIRPSYYQNLETLAYRAKDNDIPLEVTVQNSGHDTTDGRYVSPSVQQLRWQMAVAMTYGASTLDHYIFTSHEETYAPMVDFNTLKPTELFENAKTVDLELRAWEDIYCSYRWLGSGKVDTAESNMMLLRLTKSLPQDQWGVLSNIESDGDVIFGIFENAYGENAYMITNAGSTTEIPGKDYLANFEINDANVCLQFNVENCHYLKVISGGESEYVKQSADGTFQLTIPAYDGVFVIPLVEN